MPEYLSPGVYIEEVPSRLKAIEGVSTSTAGFVGRSGRGPVAGFGEPFDPTQGASPPWDLPADASPVLVTSFPQFTRTFGNTPADPLRDGYLPHSVRAFFDNGGRRCFITRVVNTLDNVNPARFATRGMLTVGQGCVLRLTRRVRSVANPTVFLDSLRGLGFGANTIQFFNLDGTAVAAPFNLGSYNSQANSVVINGTPPVALEPDRVYARPGAIGTTATGPRFHGRSPGGWFANVRVLIANADRAPAAILNTPAAATDILQFTTATSFYQGAIIAIDHGNGAGFSYNVVAAVLAGNRVRLANALANGVNAPATGPTARVLEIDITVSDQTVGVVEIYKGLTWNQDRATPGLRDRHYATVINNRSGLVYVQPPAVGNPALAGAEAADPDSQPATADGFAVGPLAGDEGDDGTPPTDDDVTGIDNGPGARTGIESLQDASDISLVAAPGFVAIDIQQALITQCQRLRYRFAILDSPADVTGPSVVNGLIAHRNAFDTSYAAIYTPWVEFTSGTRTLVLPPSGYVAGICARVDNDRGVHNAPANEVLQDATGLHAYITTGEQDLLNPRGINAIRQFEGRGIRVWGARTLSSDPEFRYVNVRRFLIFLEASLDRGTQWVVFAPNSPPTWDRVTDSVRSFLYTQWRVGALFGRRPEDAFSVRCDETTMSVDDIQNGRLICEIGVAIVRPAEFVIFRIEQTTGFANQP